MDIDEYFVELTNHLDSLHDKYLKHYFTNGLVATPSEFDLDVRSYCVLSHAAFEDYTEFVALKVLSVSIKKFINEKKVNLSLLTLFHFVIKSDNKIFDIDYKKDGIPTLFDYVRINTDDIKTVYSKMIVDNHGVSIKYLIKILFPIAIDIPADLNLINSLDQLANARGSYAHKFRDNKFATKPVSPEDAQKYVYDCKVFFEQIMTSAMAGIN